ncbi:MAG: polysaccharide biosynthesis protein [Clostridia bacterium]|nr:polysaccharide biosynthesis protein [Clostridia bacterium]
MQKKTGTSSKLVAGIIILTISNIFVKIIGVLFKIPLHNLLGGRGMSYFNAAYTIFTNLYLVSTAGLPLAISLMVSRAHARGSRKEVNRIFYTALVLFLILGVAGTSVMFFGADVLASFTGAPDASLAIAVIAPTLFFICISSSIRGYFQGHQNMLPTAISEVIESAGKFALGILFGIWATRSGKSIEVCAAYSIAGVTVGEAAGMAFLIFARVLHKQKYDSALDTDTTPIPTPKEILKKLLKISIPVMISSVALNLTNTIDTFTIVNLTKKYFPIEIAEEMYGNYTSLAIPLFHLPSAFIYPISTSIAPALSAAKAKKDRRELDFTVFGALKLVTIISIPCTIGIAVLSGPILRLLFSNKEAVAFVAPLLSILAPSIFFSGILTITSSILQANEHQSKPIVSMLCGIITKLIVSCVLLNIESIGIYGAPIGTVASYFVMSVINFVFVVKYVGIKAKSATIILKPLAASLISTAVTIAVYKLIANAGRPNVATLMSVIATAIVYFILLFIMKEFTKRDILLLPKGEKIYSLLCKIKLMKEEI